MIEFEKESSVYLTPGASIKVIGIGGAGGNTINSMIDAGTDGIDFIATNTDAQALQISKAPCKIQIGVKATKGLGSGANPELGRRAAEEDLERIMEAVAGADVVFLTAGMGGGTGTGAIPVIARALKEKDILTIAVVTKPFIFEGKRRMKIANDAIESMASNVDTLIVLPNQKLIDVVDQKMSLVGAFNMINNVLNQFVRSISDIITHPGHINVDFADVKTIMKNQGYAVIGSAKMSGEGRAIRAAQLALSSPLLENMHIQGARSVLLNITGNQDMGLHEVSAAASIIYEQAHEDANIILGSVIDESIGDEVMVTVIATGFDAQQQKAYQVAQNNVLEIKNGNQFLNSQIPKAQIETVQTKSQSYAEQIHEPKQTHHNQYNSQPTTHIIHTETKTVQLVEEVIEIKPEFKAAESQEVLMQESISDVDTNDLDVPAYMRKKVLEKQNKVS